jgi:AcrR family transcriptional regulator
MTQRTDTGKRQALLDAALQLFLANGVLETTVDDVLQLSGASVGSLYHHFGGKEQLADALYVDCLSAYHRVALEGLGAAADAEAGVRSLVDHHLD